MECLLHCPVGPQLFPDVDCCLGVRKPKLWTYSI